MAEFNLIEELPLVPCIDLDGNRIEHGIRDTLFNADRLREICDDSPLVTVAIHRLLLAILYRGFKGPSGMSEWKTLYNQGSFDPDGPLNIYLAKWHDRFFLFDGSHPFMQVAGLDLNEYKATGQIKKDKSDGLMRLAREAPDKGGRILFDHRVGTERPEYAPKEIAKMILSAQSYAGTGVASGGKIAGQPITPTPCQFAPCVDGLCIWLQGQNLFQTLMLNLVPYDICENDLPAWEDDDIVRSGVRSWRNPVNYTGPVQRFAPLSRFIRVVDRQSMFFTNGLKTTADSDDPMKAYSRSSDSDAYQAVKLREDKAAWRDAHSLFSLASITRKPPACLNHIVRLYQDGTLMKSVHPRVNVVGLATDQGKSLLWRHERMPVPSLLIGNQDIIERLGNLLQNAEQAAIELNKRSRRIADIYFSPDSESPADRQPNKNEKDDINNLVTRLDPRPSYWSRLEKHFFYLLENLSNDWDAENNNWNPEDRQIATRTWREHVKQKAKLALEESIRSLGTTARAIQAVARVRTDFSDNDLKPPPPKATRQIKRRKEARRNEP